MCTHRPYLEYLLNSIKNIVIIHMELYSIKSVVQIEKIKLNIRFPGQLSFQFKNNHLYEDIPKMYPVANGECLVDQSVALEVESVYSIADDSYSEVLVELIVNINTATGKIKAGVVTFNAIQNTTVTLPLKGCSDKTAEATIIVAFARIQKLKDVQEEPIIKQKSQSRLLANVRSRQKRSIDDLRPLTSYLGTEKKREMDRNESKDSKFLVASKIVKTGVADSRYKDLQEGYERKIKLLNREKQELQNQLENARQKWKLSERRQKEHQTTIKDLRDQSDKRRAKITDLQARLADSQRIIQDYERKMKLTQQEAKLSADKIEDLSSKYLILEKKIQSKEQSMTERERKLSEKVQQLQIQHNKTVHQYNLLLEKMELQEKVNQTLFKNKEKGYLEEKAKWKEQAEKTDKIIKKYQEDSDQLASKYNALLSSEKALNLKLSGLQAQYEILKTADQNRRFSMEKEGIIKKDLMRQLQELKSIEGDKATLKKKMHESNQQHLRLKEKLDKLTLQSEELKENMKNADRLIDQYKKEKKIMASKFADNQKTISNQQKQITRLSSQNNTLSSKNTYLNERLNDLKTRTDQQNASHAQTQTQLQSKISSLFQSKQYLEADIEDLKWSQQKSEQSIRDCQKKIKERSDEIFRYQEEKLKLEKEGEDLKLKLEQARNIISTLKNEASQAKRKEQEQSDLLKQRQRKIYEHVKRISELEQQHFITSSKLTHNIGEFKDNLTNKQSAIEELNTQLAFRKTKISQLQASLEKLQEDNQEQARQLKLLTLSLDQSDRSQKLQKQTNDELKKQNEALKRQLQQSQSKLSEQQLNYVQQINQLSIQKQLLEKQASTNQNDLDTYHKSVQQLLMIISKEDQLNRIEDIVAFPDTNLAKNQLQALKNRNKYLTSFKSNISELKIQITYLQKEIQSKSNLLHAKNQELQTTSKKNSQKTQQLQANWEKSVQNYNKHIEGLEAQLSQVRTDKQKLQNKHKTLNELYQQQKNERQQLQAQLSTSKQEIKSLQSLNLELRSRQISKKGEDQSFIHNLKVELRNQLDKHQQTISSLRSQIEGHLKTISEKQKQISALKSNVSSLEQQKSKGESNLELLQQKHSKLSQEKTNVDQNLAQHQKTISSLKEQLEKAHIQIKSEKQLKNAIQEKLKQSHEHAQQLLVCKENLENKLNHIQKNSSMSQEEQKTKIIQLEENLLNETRKSGKYFKELTEKTGELQLKQFEAKQLEKRLAQNENASNDLKKDIEEKRNTINRLNANIEDQNRRLMGVEKEKTEFSQQKNAVQDQLSIKKSKIQELQSQSKNLGDKLQKLSHQLQDSKASEAQLKEQRINLQCNINELRESLTQARKEIQRSNAKENESKTKLALVQQQLKQKEQFYQSYKSKNWEQNQREANSLKEKVKQLAAKLDILQAQRENERENLKNQIDYVSHSNQELEELLQEKQQIIENQEVQLMEAQTRIITLNGQLRNCLQAWEKEKTASIPSRKQTIKIQEDMNKFQSYAAELDRKTKEILNISTYKIKDQIMAKTSQSLVELLELLHRSKARALNKASDGEKEEIVKEYDRMREKVEEILKNQRVIIKE